MDCSTPGFPVLHYLLEFAQTHVHWVGDAIQPSHPLLSPSPPIINLSPYQGLFKWVSFTSGGQSIGASASASVLPMNIQGRFPFGLTGLEIKYPCGPRNSQEFSPAPQFKSVNSSALSLLYGPTCTSVHDYWKKHNFHDCFLPYEKTYCNFFRGTETEESSPELAAKKLLVSSGKSLSMMVKTTDRTLRVVPPPTFP